MTSWGFPGPRHARPDALCCAENGDDGGALGVSSCSSGNLPTTLPEYWRSDSFHVTAFEGFAPVGGACSTPSAFIPGGLYCSASALRGMSANIVPGSDPKRP